MPAESNLNIAIPGPEDLVAGRLATQPVTIAAATYVRGEVLGLTGNTYGKLTVAADAAAVMAEDATFAGDTVFPVYVAGEFNEDKLELNGQALAGVKTALRKLGIIVRAWGAAPSAS